MELRKKLLAYQTPAPLPDIGRAVTGQADGVFFDPFGYSGTTLRYPQNGKM
jgi:hypothetical protein